jgi:signal transduction histidine kinase
MGGPSASSEGIGTGAVGGSETIRDAYAALRRVATLVAQGSGPNRIFSRVVEEVGLLLGAEFGVLRRYEPGRFVCDVALWSRSTKPYPPISDEAVPLGGRNVSSLVFERGEPARVDGYGPDSGAAAAPAKAAGVRSTVGAPINVDGSLWGVLLVSWTRDQPLPRETDARLAEFAELAALAISNAEDRAELMASRARLVAAGDEARRRIERDLHDGIQQRLIRLAFVLRTTERQLPPDLTDARESVSRTARELSDVLVELQEISRGIHPPILTQGGLAPAFRTLARRSPVPVKVIAGSEERLPEHVEVAAYYVVTEALANVAKHAKAKSATVEFAVAGGTLTLQVRDDGVGGADRRRGSGLVGLGDRVSALGGAIDVDSPSGAGTTVRVTLPLAETLRSPSRE